MGPAYHLSFSVFKLLISCIWPPTRLCSLRPKVRVNSVSGAALFPDSSLLPGVSPSPRPVWLPAHDSGLCNTLLGASHNAANGVVQSDTPCTKGSCPRRRSNRAQR